MSNPGTVFRYKLGIDKFRDYLLCCPENPLRAGFLLHDGTFSMQNSAHKE